MKSFFEWNVLQLTIHNFLAQLSKFGWLTEHSPSIPSILGVFMTFTNFLTLLSLKLFSNSYILFLLRIQDDHF